MEKWEKDLEKNKDSMNLLMKETTDILKTNQESIESLKILMDKLNFPKKIGQEMIESIKNISDLIAAWSFETLKNTVPGCPLFGG